MSNLSCSESRHMYSWWWDSHNTPKNSKWLQDNLTDIDGKIKSMIKLIEEDADSFALRAEMYYKKRPELMKLVEEFYRAYRALAERYNHATGELRHAQQTIAKAFPDEVPFELVEDSPPSQERSGPHKLPAHAVFNADDLLDNNVHRLSSSEGGPRNKGLKQLPEMFGYEKTRARNPNLEDKILDETVGVEKAVSEVQCLKKALDDMKAEKENVLVQYQQCLEKLSEIELELNNAQKDSTSLSERASRAEIEVQTLKEALIQFEVEKIAEMIKQNDYLEKISHLEDVASRFQEDMKDQVSRLELEKETVVCQYKHCLEKISELEKIISSNENEARSLKKQAEISETEVVQLKRAFADLNKEKEDMALQYMCCLEKISELERDLSIAKNNVERLNNEVLSGNAKLETALEKCALMETSNRSLRDEADNLAKKIAIKDQELVKKQGELEKLQSCLEDEHSHHAQVEATLESLQNLHSQSQDDQRALAVERNNTVRMLRDMEISKNSLEEEIQHVKDENRSLSRTNLSSSVSMESMRYEIVCLMEIRERLENEVSHHVGITVSLQKEILCLKEEIQGLNKSYQCLVDQIEAAGLNPKCVDTSIKSLHDENSKLRRKCEQENVEKEILSKKQLEEIEEVLKKKAVIESSLSDLIAELVLSRGKVKEFQESSDLLRGEKAALFAEKASILSQLQAMAENMRSLLGKNAVVEDSLSTAKVELQGLREKSKGLEEICELLKNERSYLLTERSTLVSKLENVEKRLRSLDKQYMELEEKYADLEKEKEYMHCRVEKLKVSLSEEKQERKGSQLDSEKRLAGLENHIHLLQEENRWKRKESEEELDKSLKAEFEISILQKFIKDMEEKNSALIIECQKHVEASKLAEKLISELEGESLEQQVESELLLDEIERLRLGIYQIFRVLESGSDCAHDDGKVENEQTFVYHILGSIEDLQCCASKHEEEKQQLLVENLVLLALLEQLESKSIEIESQKVHLERKSKIMTEKLVVVENEKNELLALQEAYSRVNEENTYLLKKNSELNEEKFLVDQHNDSILHGFLATSNESAVLRSFGREKVTELKSLLEDLSRQHDLSTSLEKEMNGLREKLELQKAENLVLKDSVCGLEREMQDYSTQKKEIESLHVVNKNLESEIVLLRQEMEENTVREHTLSTELQEMNNEFELWEAEASAFCFDLQVSSIHEVLLKNKVQELCGVCQCLEHKHESKMSEIERMKGKFCLMENEVSELKSQLHAYAPVIASLRDDVAILERNALLHKKLHDTELMEVAARILPEDQSLLSLQNLQMRVKAVGKLMEESNEPIRSNSDSIQEFSTVEIDHQLKPPCQSFSRKKGYTKSSQVRNGTIMKDIPLDQVSNNSSRREMQKKGKVGSDDLMLELWETAEDENKDIVYDQYENVKGKSLLPLTDSDVEKELAVDNLLLSAARKIETNQETNDTEILEKLASDAEKLEILQTTLRNMRRKLETNKKSIRKVKNVDFERVQEQLQEAEDNAVHLVDLNGQLVKNIEYCPEGEMEETVRRWRVKVMEQAQKGSERIERLQSGLQKIQYDLLKIEDEKKSKGKNKFLGSKTIILRDFIDNGRKNSRRRKKKDPRCGCFRQSNSGNENSS